MFLLTALPGGRCESRVTDGLTEALRGGHSPEDVLLASSSTQGIVTWSMPGQRLRRWRSWQCRRLGFDPWARRIRWSRRWSSLQYSCLGNPWTEESGGLQSTESQRVGHERLSAHTCDRADDREIVAERRDPYSGQGRLRWVMWFVSLTACHSA